MIDPQSYSEAKAEIDDYLKLVQSRGLHPILVIDSWGVPDSIRAELIRLYNDKVYPIEGCVFIGDIPIARTRDAQHFTTAFKMDQDGQFDRTEYTVASDRFYDTFELQWDYLDRDSVRPEYFYYLRDLTLFLNYCLNLTCLNIYFLYLYFGYYSRLNFCG